MNHNNFELENEFEIYVKLIAVVEKLNSEMLTPGDINAALNATRLISGGLSELMKIAQKSNDIATKKLIVDLESKIVDVEHSLLQSKKEINRLLEENSELKKQLEFVENPKIILKDGLYYDINDPDNPFCTTCYDKDKKLIRVQEVPDIMKRVGNYKYKCYSCNTLYTEKKD